MKIKEKAFHRTSALTQFTLSDSLEFIGKVITEEEKELVSLIECHAFEIGF